MNRRIHGEGADHPSIAASLNQLGRRDARERGQYDVEEEWYRRSLGMKKRIHGEGVDHPSIAALVHQLGLVAQYRGPVRRGRRVVSEEAST